MKRHDIPGACSTQGGEDYMQCPMRAKYYTRLGARPSVEAEGLALYPAS